MQTENGYPQWHMSFLTPKISVRDKWSVMSLTFIIDKQSSSSSHNSGDSSFCD